MSITVQEAEKLVKEVLDPHVGKSLGSAKAVKAVSLEGGVLKVELSLGYPARTLGK